MPPRRRVWLPVALAALGIAVVAWLPPLHQDPEYHRFADGRTLLGIPNFWNVVSNVPFAVVGMIGLRFARRRMGRGWKRTAVTVLFAGVAATAAGSAWYHLAPGDGTLFWDRLPMTLGFTALFALVIGEGAVLWPLVAAGAASVIYWQVSGDLRFYGLVQYLPMASIPVMVLLWPDDYAPAGDLWAGLACYGSAKIFELLDARIFAVGEVMGGHAIKHLAAAAACGYLLRHFAVKEPRKNALAAVAVEHDTRAPRRVSLGAADTRSAPRRIKGAKSTILLSCPGPPSTV